MCYGDDARPPVAPVSGGSVAQEGPLTLTSADGTRFMAYAARANEPTGTGVVILPDIRGLHEFYKELAARFAEAGFDAVAFDFFGRTAETDNRDETFAFRPHVDQTRPETVAADTAAAIAYLRSPEGGAVRRVFTVGFCFGGGHSWRQSAAQPGLDGAIGFYGVPSRVKDVVPEMKAPLLLLVAGEDFTPLAEFEQFDQELTEAGVPHTMVVYEGAPHSFFDRTAEQHREASADAWEQMLRFMGR
ncbi:MAG: dienelactone hydrolase family protein [Thermomicrobiales bacterium]|nr:dienelactone hydrolase family protein [Thermomicrobiales bacterium]